MGIGNCVPRLCMTTLLVCKSWDCERRELFYWYVRKAVWHVHVVSLPLPIYLGFVGGVNKPLLFLSGVEAEDGYAYSVGCKTACSMCSAHVSFSNEHRMHGGCG